MTSEQQVQYETGKRIKKIINLPDNSSRRWLAEMRRGVGMAPGASPALWGMLFQDLPEEFFSVRREPSRAEWAIYTALTLFALHQQGKNIKTDCMDKEGISLGSAVAMLMDSEDDRERIWRRFQPVTNAKAIEDVSYHLRGIIQLLKAKGICLDYSRLAGDLFVYQDVRRADSIRLIWGEDFYRVKKEEPDNEE